LIFLPSSLVSGRSAATEMVSVNKFFTSVLLAVVYTSVTDAAPWPTSSKNPTHRVRHIGRGVQIEAFHPKSTYEASFAIPQHLFARTIANLVALQTFGTGIDQPGARSQGGLQASAVSFVQSRLGVDSNSISYNAGYSADAGQYAYVKQYHVCILILGLYAPYAFPIGWRTLRQCSCQCRIQGQQSCCLWVIICEHKSVLHPSYDVPR